MKLCECGCGQPTSIATKTDASTGRVRGRPMRFIRGHNGRQPFWDRVAVGGPDECWEWQGPVDDDGYGTHRAHRKAWALANGPILPGLCVLHSCDNPPCCNPAHLFLGTHADNAADRIAKGRPGGGRRGEAHHAARLDAERVREIRHLATGSVSLRALAARFGIAEATLRDVVKGRTWSHIA